MKSNRVRKKSLFAVGAIALVSVALPSASASMGNGYFKVQAANAEEPTIKAVAGLDGVDDGGPDGEGPQLPTDPSEVGLLSYQCGPMSLTITQEMADFSKRNEAVHSASGASGSMETHPDNWKIISSKASNSSPRQLGLPADGSKPGSVSLSNANSGNADFTAEATDEASHCFVNDYRAKPAHGVRYGYGWMSPGMSTQNEKLRDQRFFEEDGELKAIMSVLSHSDVVTVYRFKDSQKNNSVRDPYGNGMPTVNKPHVMKISPDGAVTLSANLQIPKEQGPSFIDINQRADGSGSLTYGEIKSGPVESSPKSMKYRTTDGPVALEYNSAGQITSFEYFKPGVTWATTKSGNGLFSTADYNSITGQNWDGKFHTASDFDTSIPFRPAPFPG